MKLLITGATGFVGPALTHQACHDGYQISALVRSQTNILPLEANQIVIGDLVHLATSGGKTDASEGSFVSAMENVDVIIHAAARAHVMKEDYADPAAIYHLVNVTLTERLAEAAAKAGVKRFVFLSSVKVNGEATFSKAFTEQDTPAPEDAYGQSKWQAEQALIAIGQRTGMEIVILRPPLVYGSGVKGNFASLIKLVQKGIPLPFAMVNNQRSLIALDNLVSAILLAAKHPAAANQTYLVADNEAVSTPQLIRFIAEAQGKKARLIPVPVSLMRWSAGLLGKKSVADRLFGSLEIDTLKIRQTLDWKPVTTMSRQLEKMLSQRV